MIRRRLREAAAVATGELVVDQLDLAPEVIA
jgi:hypothetical protein